VYNSFNPKDQKLGLGSRYEGGTDQKHLSKILYPNEACWTSNDGVYLFVEDIIKRRTAIKAFNPKIVFFNGRYLPDDRECQKFSWIRDNYIDTTGGKKLIVEEPKKKVMGNKINIITFWWGNWPGKDGSGISYIEKLIKGVEKYMPIGQEYEFILFTDIENLAIDGATIRHLDVPSDLMWNLKKIFMFSEEAMLEGPTICFDLDTVITGDLSPLISTVKKLVDTEYTIITCEDAYKHGQSGGAIVGFIPSVDLELALWNPIVIARKKVEAMTKGSERFYYRKLHSKGEVDVIFWEKLIPGNVLSYKKDCVGSVVVPKKVSAIRFHGRPRPHQVVRGWIKEAWDGN